MIRTASLALALSLTTALGASAQTLYFSAIPDEDETRLVERFSKVADYLEGELGVDVQFVPVKSYAASVTAFRNDQIQLAWFGGLTGVQARLAVPEARAIAQGKEDPIFVSYFIANTETGLEPSDSFPAEAQGMSFTFGAKTVTLPKFDPPLFLKVLKQHSVTIAHVAPPLVGFLAKHPAVDTVLPLVGSGS